MEILFRPGSSGPQLQHILYIHQELTHTYPFPPSGPFPSFFFFRRTPKALYAVVTLFFYQEINQTHPGSLFNFLLSAHQKCPSQRRRSNQPILPPTHLHLTPAHCIIIHSRCGPNPGGSPKKRPAFKVPQIHNQIVMCNQKWERRSKRMSPLQHPHHRHPPRIRNKTTHPVRDEPFSKRRAGTPLIAIRWFVTRSINRSKCRSSGDLPP